MFPTLESFTHIINQLLPEPHASLLAGMLFGIKRSMPNEFYQALITTGTLHVIALSGTNIVLLMRLVAMLTLGIASRRVSSLLTIFFIILFIFFVGPSPSVVRAGLMGSLTLVAVYFGRKNWSLLSLGIATIIIFLVRPDWIYSLSFQLSFGATLGIILFGGESKTMVYSSFYTAFKRSLIADLRLTLSAQVFTIPLILYYFGQLSLISPLANLATGWLVGPIMIIGFVVVMIGMIWLPLGRLAALVVWVPLALFISLVRLCAGLPFASIQW